ncbi:Uncharacterised protein [Candidatus Bilamarchaeum dharawalense]|uniref:Uncharacterized protein n=1 Tax=Candidatus Bilamarchaeum dharawalense TaxID=2885759 RepID=A0A5E4LPQ0_9ARCH|nr:Uncharacterised protein [Candidatus Bilamarchaeum dharawalense]
MRAFIFSLDAFVAFTLALVVIYSLIFFSSVPSAYYYLLTQAHYLTRDVLYSLSTTRCSTLYSPCSNAGTSVLDNIAFPEAATFPENLIQDTVGSMVPNQFGYAIEVSKDMGQTWLVAYNTSAKPSDPHAKTTRKLQVSTQIMVFNYPDTLKKMGKTPYNYNSCGFGAGWVEGVPGSDGSTWTNWGEITCGLLQINGSSPGSNGTIIGNTPPENLLHGDLVPSTDVRVVKFTVFI